MLLRPRVDAIDIEGQHDLVLTRNPNACTLDLSYDSNVHAKVSDLHFVTLTGKTRIRRFIYAMKFVWKHCK